MKQRVVRLDLEPIDWLSFAPGPVIGVDEVGRGCLAGPVYVAAAVLPLDFGIDGVTDSKLVSEKRRSVLAAKILEQARVSVAFANVDEIAELNILQATFLAMRRAIEGLGETSGHVLIDGNQKIPGLSPAFRQTTVIKGDLRALPIGAASIVAKVTRDRWMSELAERYPGYGFEKHKGYASSEHRDAIQRLGPCPEHRRTFAGVREYWPQRASPVVSRQGTLL